MRRSNPAGAALDAADATARRVLVPLIFETLVTSGGESGPRGVLALDWEGNATGTRWHFRLRPGVRLHDGTPLDSGRIAAALRVTEPGWRITSDASSLTIELDRAADLAWQLSDTRYAIAFARPGGGEPIGSG